MSVMSSASYISCYKIKDNELKKKKTFVNEGILQFAMFTFSLSLPLPIVR